MGKARLLFVEDDLDTRQMMKIYFSAFDFDVYLAERGSDALEIAHQALPHLIILDIMLPDYDGYEICRNLRINMRTSHIPVIFLTQHDGRSDKLQALELGADDYITKPFDIEELKLRVHGAIRRSERESLTHPSTGLPSGHLIEDQLRRIIRQKGWALLDTGINHFDSFRNVYGFVAGDDMLRFTSMLISEVMDELGAASDFVGHAGGDNFVIITNEKKADIIKARLKERFDNEVLTHYNFMDRQQGFIQSQNVDGTTDEISFMTMSIGIVAPSLQSFADIREITELSAEARRQDTTEKLLSKVIEKKDWAYLHLQIKEFEAFREVYGVSDSNEVKWFTVKIIREVMSELKLVDSFIGHTSKDEFVIVLPQEFTKVIRENLKSRFDNEVLSHYHYIHREHEYIRTKDHKKHSLMKLTIRAVSPTHLANIRKIAKLDQYTFTLDD